MKFHLSNYNMEIMEVRIISKNIETQHLNNIYKDIAEEFGIETAIKIHKLYKGLQINFPVRFYNKNYIIKQIREEFDGTNIKNLAQKYEYSERWIREILSIDK